MPIKLMDLFYCPNSEAWAWLERAEEARVIADGMRHEPARKLMLQVANTYDTLAARAWKQGEE